MNSAEPEAPSCVGAPGPRLGWLRCDTKPPVGLFWVLEGSFEGDIGPYKAHIGIHWQSFGL